METTNCGWLEKAYHLKSYLCKIFNPFKREYKGWVKALHRQQKILITESRCHSGRICSRKRSPKTIHHNMQISMQLKTSLRVLESNVCQGWSWSCIETMKCWKRNSDLRNQNSVMLQHFFGNWTTELKWLRTNSKFTLVTLMSYLTPVWISTNSNIFSCIFNGWVPYTTVTPKSYQWTDWSIHSGTTVVLSTSLSK